MKKLFCTMLCLSAFVAVVPAEAKEKISADRPVMNVKDFYAGVDVGAIIPASISVNLTGALVGSGHVNPDSGAIAGVFAGYHLNEYLAGEAALDYTSFGQGKLTGTITGLGAGTFDYSGNFDVALGTINAIITPLGRHDAFTPYFGGGLGFAHVNQNSSVISFRGVPIGTNPSQTKTDLAVDLAAGFDYAANDDVSLGARYRYIWINSGEKSTAAGITETDGNASAHTLTASATYHF